MLSSNLAIKNEEKTWDLQIWKYYVEEVVYES